MPQSTIFCDFDGPIVDVSDRYYATYRAGLDRLAQVAQAEGRSPAIRCLSKSQFWTFKQNRVPDRQIAHWSGLEGEYIDRFLGEVGDLVNHTSLLGHDRLQPRVRESLELFRQGGVRVILVTLRSPHQVIAFLRSHRLEWAIADLFGMNSVESAYHNRAQHKIERLAAAIDSQHHQGYDLRQAWMIGDTEADILAGQALGLDTVAVTCGIRSSSYLQAFRPTHLIPDLWAAAQKLQQHLTLGYRL
jgi:phosphoglycolate phosphatase